MQRDDFLHVLHAAALVTGETEFVVIGSQAILGSHPDPPDVMLRSLEADVYPLHAAEKVNLIDGAIGDGSAFQAQFGYYAHGVGPETAKAPEGWEDRLVRVDVPARGSSGIEPVALCLEPHDLVLSKLAANRERDWEFARNALDAGLVELSVLTTRAPTLPVADELRSLIVRSLAALS
jgi:hypothetical protein